MGGKKKSSKAYTPYDQPDSVKSYQEARILDALSEGEVEGLVNGLKSVYFNDTPLENIDGTFNFKNVEVEGRYGTPHQEKMDGFELIERENIVNVEVKHDKPVIRSIVATDVKSVRLTLHIPALFQIMGNGDNLANSVGVIAQVKKSGRVLFSIYRKISEKSISAINFNMTLDNLPEAPFEIAVLRENKTTTSSKSKNNLIWSGYTEIIHGGAEYPNTAYVGVKFNSENFGGMPKRTYLLKGLLVKIPENYNPETRQYQGLWNGRFKVAWTDNPAWIFYDVCTNPRYGLGDRLQEINVDKWNLYTIARYCDELVSDGNGGQEPRATCNIAITKEYTAYELLNNITSIFRAIPVWNGQQLTVIADIPKDPVYLYNNSNVKDGVFTYTSTSKNTRYSVVHVEYIDKNDGYLPKTAYVEDEYLLNKYGLNVNKVVAFGATSIGQAVRLGKWILSSIRTETQAVTFTVGQEGLKHLPGDIVKIADNHRSNEFLGGRILSIKDNKVTLDREIKIGANAKISLINSISNEIFTSAISSISKNVITLSQVFLEDTDVKAYSVYTIDSEVAVTKLYRCLSIEELENSTYKISAVEHNPNKQFEVDNIGTQIVEKSILPIPPVGYTSVSDSNGVSIKAIKPNTNDSLKYNITLYKNGKNIGSYLDLNEPNYNFSNLSSGEYTAEIVAKASDGRLSAVTSVNFAVTLELIDFKFTSEMYAVACSFEYGKGASSIDKVNVYTSSMENGFNSAKLVQSLKPPINTFRIANLELGQVLKVYIQAVDVDNNVGEVKELLVSAIDDVNLIINSIEGKINKSSLNASLVNDLTNTTNSLIASSKKQILASVKHDDDLIKSDLSKFKNLQATKDTAIIKATTTLASNLNNAKSDLANYKKLKLAEDTAIKNTLNTATADIVASNKKIEDSKNLLATEIANAKNDLNTKVSTLASSLDSAKSDLTNFKNSQATKDTATSKSITTLNSSINSAKSDLANFKKSQATKDSATAKSITTLTSNLNSAKTDLTNFKNSQATKDKATATSVSSLNSKLATTTADLTNFKNSQATKDTATSNSITTLASSLDSAKSDLTNFKNSQATKDTATSKSITTLTAKIDNIDVSDIIKKRTLDLSKLDKDTYYPVVTNSLSVINATYIKVYRDMQDGGATAPWGSHKTNKRFYLTAEWTVNSENWGYAIVNRNIITFSYRWTLANRSPILNLNHILYRTGQECFFLRGGTTYYVDSTKGVNFYIKTSRYTNKGRTVEPTKTYNTTLVPTTTEKRLNSTYTVKTQAIHGNKKAIAGISLGSSIDNKTAESSVIFLADNFSFVKDTNDGTPKKLLTLVNGQMALNGDFIASGTIAGESLKANSNIVAPNIVGGTIRGSRIEISDKFRLQNDGSFNIGSGLSNGVKKGLQINNNSIEIYDDNGNLRVKIGKLV